MPVKRVTGEQVLVSADIISDGHDTISAELLFRKEGEKIYSAVRMFHSDNDRWEGTFTVEDVGSYYYTLRAWVDHFYTWQKDFEKRIEASQDIKVELLIGAQMIEEASFNAGAEEDKKIMLSAVEEMKNPDGAASSELALSKKLTCLMYKYTDRSMATVFENEYEVWVERKKALFSSWYEFFPRSTGRTADTEHSKMRKSFCLISPKWVST